MLLSKSTPPDFFAERPQEESTPLITILEVLVDIPQTTYICISGLKNDSVSIAIRENEATK